MGNCAQGVAQDSEAVPPAELPKVEVRPFGVLGTQLLESGHISSSGGEPSQETVIVDPADLFYISTMGPNAPGGAAGANYKWLGIKGEPSFPEPVREACQRAPDAKFHAYADGTKLCIHSVGPDFRDRELGRTDAVMELAQAYCNVLAEFAASGRPSLRLLPISGGIFIGPQFADELPAMTAEAFYRGCSLLSAEQRRQLSSARSIEMCIFLEAEYAAFVEAFKARGGQ